MARIERGAPVSAERGGSRGRRDPALRQRINNDQPVYDEDAPEGEVRVRGPEDGPTQEIDLDELSDEQYADLIARRIIDDGDSGVIEIDLGELVGSDEEELDAYELLAPGDVVYAKVHHPVRFDDDPSNFTYGIATRIKEGESEEEAFIRVSTITNTRALDLAQAAMEPVMHFKDDVMRARKEQLNTRSALRSKRASTSEGE